MADGNSDSGNIQVIVAAVILGLCVIAGSLIVSRAVEDTSAQIAAVQAGVVDLKTSLAAAAARPAPAARAATPPRRGPDPNRVYEVATAGAPSLGPAEAKVTIVAFSDFQCPFCRRVNPALEQVREAYGQEVRIVFKHLPLAMHTKAPAAHAAAEAAYQQGKFWEMHDLLFENQRALSEDKYPVWAGELGLDVERFKRDVKSAKVKARIDGDTREASSLGVSGTPAFFINGRYLSGAKPFAEFKRVIDKELKS